MTLTISLKEPTCLRYSIIQYSSFPLEHTSQFNIPFFQIQYQDMAIEKLFLCLTTLVILAAIPASCAPQLWNFGWPSQQESIPRFPARAFMPAEAGPNSRPLSFMPSPLSPSVPMPTVAASSPQRQVPMAQQPRKFEKQDTVPESRLFIGPTTPVSITSK
jgi:hypothetical protein